MAQRLLDNTKWLWCILVIQTGSISGQTHSVGPQNHPADPTTVEAQAKFFQDFFSVQLSPYKMEFGHVCEDGDTWEQRYEKKDFKNHRDMGKVRWGDKKGGYGEHYWDLNHAGHTGSHENDGNDNDDGSYHDEGNSEHFDEPSDTSSNYNHDDYDPETVTYDDNGRKKRANPKIKAERKPHSISEIYEGGLNQPLKLKRRNKEEILVAATNINAMYTNNNNEGVQDEEKLGNYEIPKITRHQNRKQNENKQKLNYQRPKERNQIVLVVTEKDDSEKRKPKYQPQHTKRKAELSQYLPRQTTEPSYTAQHETDVTQYVSYKGNNGVWQYHQPEASAAALVSKQPTAAAYTAQHEPGLTQYVSYKGGDGVRQYFKPEASAAPLVSKLPTAASYTAQHEPDLAQYVPYEGGAGVRQYLQPEARAGTAVSRLFLEPATGHVVDRTTGQAFILQPILP